YAANAVRTERREHTEGSDRGVGADEQRRRRRRAPRADQRSRRRGDRDRAQEKGDDPRKQIVAWLAAVRPESLMQPGRRRDKGVGVPRRRFIERSLEPLFAVHAHVFDAERRERDDREDAGEREREQRGAAARLTIANQQQRRRDNQRHAEEHRVVQTAERLDDNRRR